MIAARDRGAISALHLRKVFPKEQFVPPRERSGICKGRTRKTEVPVVRDLSFSVPKGECLGLLGPNGAGKTTSFGMITGELQPTSGDAQLHGHDIATEAAQAFQHLGLCPQFDAQYDHLTCNEHLRLFARLKGVPEDQVPF